MKWKTNCQMNQGDPHRAGGKVRDDQLRLCVRQIPMWCSCTMIRLIYVATPALNKSAKANNCAHDLGCREQSLCGLFVLQWNKAIILMKISFLVGLDYDRKMRSICRVKVFESQWLKRLCRHIAEVSTIRNLYNLAPQSEQHRVFQENWNTLRIFCVNT